MVASVSLSSLSLSLFLSLSLSLSFSFHAALRCVFSRWHFKVVFVCSLSTLRRTSQPTDACFLVCISKREKGWAANWRRHLRRVTHFATSRDRDTERLLRFVNLNREYHQVMDKRKYWMITPWAYLEITKDMRLFPCLKGG